MTSINVRKLKKSDLVKTSTILKNLNYFNKFMYTIIYIFITDSIVKPHAICNIRWDISSIIKFNKLIWLNPIDMDWVVQCLQDLLIMGDNAYQIVLMIAYYYNLNNVRPAWHLNQMDHIKTNRYTEKNDTNYYLLHEVIFFVS